MLREMLAQTSFAISHDESRFALNGVLFVLQAKEVRFVAPDGHRLALATREVGQGLSGVSGIVPRKAVVEIMRCWGQRGRADRHHGKPVRHADAELRDDRPTHRRTVSELGGRPARNHPGRLALKRSSLSAALRRVSVMAEERNKPVRFVLASGSLTLSAASHDLARRRSSSKWITRVESSPSASILATSSTR